MADRSLNAVVRSLYRLADGRSIEECHDGQ
jgi:hypothetical protein